MRRCEEHSFISHDGMELFYRYWPAETEESPAQGLVLFHRGHEHSGRLQNLVHGLDLPSYAMFAWDARGHGRNPGERGYADHFGVLIKDADYFVAHIVTTYNIGVAQLAVIAQSVGAVIATAWIHDFAPKIRGLVIASPAFHVKLYIPFAVPLLRLLLRFKPKAFINSYVKSQYLTHDPERQREYDADPLITRAIAVNILLGLYDVSQRVIQDAGAITVPTQLLISGADWVVEQEPQHRFFRGLSSTVKEVHELPGFYHDTFGELECHRVIAMAREFILRIFSQPLATPSLLESDRRWHTFEEFSALAQPLPFASFKSIGFALTKAALTTVGKLSDGVALGIETGFDSGSMLDYVYRNQPAGVTFLGGLIDRVFLESIGWRGIRQRKLHLEILLAQAVAAVRQTGLPVRVVDIAAGHGRYVLEGLEQAAPGEFTALLRDYAPLNVERGRALIATKGMSSLVRFEQGDAFDGEDLARLEPRPTIAMVSGLYELFPENGPVQNSLNGLGRAVMPGGFLLYTNQPWHPQLEFIARVLTSHRGGTQWVMRRRTQGEMDQMVEVAGFVKVAQWIDPWGVFSVSLARKPE